ncbi:hypothetical protein LNY53_29630 [Klebsiella pneumoniae]|nr:hypothetical protein [Klebsiella pneumoniae]
MTFTLMLATMFTHSGTFPIPLKPSSSPAATCGAGRSRSIEGQVTPFDNILDDGRVDNV